MRDGVLLFAILLMASACARFAWWLIPVPITIGMTIQQFWLDRHPVTVGRAVAIVVTAAIATVILGWH